MVINVSVVVPWWSVDQADTPEPSPLVGEGAAQRRVRGEPPHLPSTHTLSAARQCLAT